ncbi:hypothetical protein 1 [Haematobia irritans densovirus]|uniref:Uncharacterized protein n=2 Tax=root TaxID=1 RepID=A0A4D6V390_9VIRU|nr:hypothetical protein 1 [Haematobia irritans densovirus]QCH41362.1 hypothetical protein 1 [Haematobia irritans densovirus]
MTELTNSQKKLMKLFLKPEVLQRITVPKFRAIVDLEEQKSPELLNLQDVLIDVRSITRGLEGPLTTSDLETQSSDESSNLLEQLTEALSLYLPSLKKETELNLKEYLTCLMEDAATPYLSGLSSMGTTSTSYMTAHTAMDRADVLTNTRSIDELEELYRVSPSAKKTINYSSITTLKLDEKPKEFRSETSTTPDFFVDLKMYDMNKIPPEEIGSKEMWRYAIIRTKFYGSNLLDGAIQEAARKVTTMTIKTIKKRLEDENTEEQPRKKTKRSSK